MPVQKKGWKLIEDTTYFDVKKSLHEVFFYFSFGFRMCFGTKTSLDI